jgi:pyruvate dehydrogenase E1 component alpha subunit
MPGVIVDGMDAVAVHEAAGVAIRRAREGAGPTLLECKTYRFYDHVGVRGMGLNYRTDDELAQWQARDPITLLEERLADLGVMTAEAARAVHEEIRADVEAGVAFAESSPMPDPDTLLEDVYA